MQATGLEYTINPGEGAFYGPKLEFVLRTPSGATGSAAPCRWTSICRRVWARLRGEDGERHVPGDAASGHARIGGALLRHSARTPCGHLPLWLSPVQVVVNTITLDADDYAHEVVQALRRAGIRAESDLRNEKISYKVREHSLAKVPVQFALGKREVEERTVSVRRLGSKQQRSQTLDEAVAGLAAEIEQHTGPLEAADARSVQPQRRDLERVTV